MHIPQRLDPSHSFVSPSPEHLFLSDASVRSPVAKPVYYVPKDIHVFVDRQGGISWTGRSCLGGASVSFPSSLRVELVLDVARGLDVVVVEDLRVPGQHLSAKCLIHTTASKTYIMIFHVSTGRSASLKLQSNFSWAMGSSLGSWYGARYSCARASVAVIRFLGSNTSMRSSRSIATTTKLAHITMLVEIWTHTRRVRILELVLEGLPLALGQRFDESQSLCPVSSCSLRKDPKGDVHFR